MTEPPPPARLGRTRFATRGAARLAYEADAPPANPAASRTLLFLHDLLADRTAFADVRAALAAARADRGRLLLPDARGHGASAALAGLRYGLADLAADAAAVLDAEGVARVDLVGHGLGGATALAMAMAQRAPGRVRSLVLIEPTLPGVLADDPDPAVRAVHAADRTTTRAAIDAAYKELTDKALDTLLDARWGAGWRDRLPRPRLAAIRRHAGALAPLLTALDAGGPTTLELRAIEMPVLVVHGEAATPLACLVCARLAAQLPTGRLATIPAATDPATPFSGEAGAELVGLLAAFFAHDDAPPDTDER